MGKVHAYFTDLEQAYYESGVGAGRRGSIWENLGNTGRERDAYTAGYKDGHNQWADGERAKEQARASLAKAVPTNLGSEGVS